jgi:hypothetical protein
VHRLHREAAPLTDHHRHTPGPAATTTAAAAAAVAAVLLARGHEGPHVLGQAAAECCGHDGNPGGKAGELHQGIRQGGSAFLPLLGAPARWGCQHTCRGVGSQAPAPASPPHPSPHVWPRPALRVEAQRQRQVGVQVALVELFGGRGVVRRFPAADQQPVGRWGCAARGASRQRGARPPPHPHPTPGPPTSSSSTAPTPSSPGSRCTRRSRMPSVTTSTRVAALTWRFEGRTETRAARWAEGGHSGRSRQSGRAIIGTPEPLAAAVRCARSIMVKTAALHAASPPRKGAPCSPGARGSRRSAPRAPPAWRPCGAPRPWRRRGGARAPAKSLSGGGRVGGRGRAARVAQGSNRWGEEEGSMPVASGRGPPHHDALPACQVGRRVLQQRERHARRLARAGRRLRARARGRRGRAGVGFLPRARCTGANTRPRPTPCGPPLQDGPRPARACSTRQLLASRPDRMSPRHSAMGRPSASAATSPAAAAAAPPPDCGAARARCGAPCCRRCGAAGPGRAARGRCWVQAAGAAATGAWRGAAAAAAAAAAPPPAAAGRTCPRPQHARPLVTQVCWRPAGLVSCALLPGHGDRGRGPGRARSIVAQSDSIATHWLPKGDPDCRAPRRRGRLDPGRAPRRRCGCRSGAPHRASDPPSLGYRRGSILQRRRYD